jgi:sporulation protein YlmC with PRC-barrel domain
VSGIDALAVKGGKKMEIPLRADVHCTDVDGSIGHSLYVVIDPVAEQVTHVVVRDRQRLDVERLVPLELVQETAPKRIWLSCTKDAFRALRPFIAKEYLRAKSPFADYDRDGVLVLPYVLPRNGSLSGEQQHRPVSGGKLAVRRGSRIEATNGPIGTVDEFMVDPADGSITHLVLRQGHPWGERDVVIPLSEIDRVKDNVVYLRLNRMRVGLLPSVSALRKWT